MKEVRAYVKEHALIAVVLALHEIDGLTGLSITPVSGFGRGGSPEWVEQSLTDHPTHVKIETVCRDELVEKVVEAIRREAHTGLRGDGKIYVVPVEGAVHISTGERGEAAV